MSDRVIRIDKEKKKNRRKKRTIIEKKGEEGREEGKKKKKTGRKIKRTTIFIFASLKTVSPITSNFFQCHV